MSFGDIIQQRIDESLGEAIKIMNCEAHNEQITELHNCFNAAKNAIEHSRRETLLYVTDVIDNFFEKGFRDGMEFTRLLLEAEAKGE